jgi:exopolysaccharide biosynthesis polyprenyl glycosylphosphotransferase
MRHYLSHPNLRHALAAGLSDALALSIALAIAYAYQMPELSPPEFGTFCIGAITAAAGLLYYCDAYSVRTLISVSRAARQLLVGGGLVLFGSLIAYFALKTPGWAVPFAATALLAYVPLFLLGRTVLSAIWPTRGLQDRLLILGVSELGLAIADVLQHRERLGTVFLGFLSDDYAPDSKLGHGTPVLGRMHEVGKLARELDATHVIVASRSRTEFFPAEELLALKVSGSVRVESGVDYFERLTGRIYMRDLRESYLIFSEGFRVRPLSAAAKRVVDILGAGVGLLFAAPLLSLIALAIKLDSKGPVFYRQDRLGRNGKIFRIAKLRSMVVDAEKLSGPQLACQKDPRVTRVGRFLRRTRIDELPQLWNVLIGDMSLVGPRPERPEIVETLNENLPLFRLRTAVRPGVTGWAQIRHGYVNEMEGFADKLSHDLYYMKARSLTMDLMILWRTARTMLLMDGV